MLIPFVHSILGAVLPSVANDTDEIKELAIKTNTLLEKLINVTDQEIMFDELLQQISFQVCSKFVHTRLAALRWAFLLYDKYPQSLVDNLENLFAITLTDTSSEVLTLCLDLMARIGQNEEYFLKLMECIISIFNRDKSLLEKKGTSVLRQLSLFFTPTKVSRSSSVFCRY